MTGLRRALAAGIVSLLLSLPRGSVAGPEVAWHPASPRVADVVLVEVTAVSALATVTGVLGGVPLAFSADGDRRIALVGLDLHAKPGSHAWQVEIQESGQPRRSLGGSLSVGARSFNVQRLTLPRAMVELEPETERRALAEADRLRALYRTVTPQRLWRGRFVRPLSSEEPGSGFGARRVINGLARAPHGGVDYSAPAGTPIQAVNSGRVALVAEFFFPGRLVILDHGLGLYTLYFHLESALVREGQVVGRGEVIGTVGSTGRATGPHLHFGAQIGEARVDPEVLLALDLE